VTRFTGSTDPANYGFPKSFNVALAIDKAAGVNRDVVGELPQKVSNGEGRYNWNTAEAGTGKGETFDVTVATSDDAKRWDGWGTALKPAHEPVVLARKPLAGTIAETVLAYGTGALNIDGCEIGVAGEKTAVPGTRGANENGATDFPGRAQMVDSGGRWPSNVLLQHLPECLGSGPHHTDRLCAPGCPVRELNEASGLSTTPGEVTRGAKGGDFLSGIRQETQRYAAQGDSGGAARFFYVAKPRTRERIGGTIRNLHVTVKPIDLMRYLVRLVTPPDGTVLDPFLGSGTTGCAAMVEGFRFIGVEKDQDSFDTAAARVSDYAFAHGRERPQLEHLEPDLTP
jgi:site-specific DNA-methyltransferase (adenine-specific)